MASERPNGYERVRRLLLLVPYVVKHPGITVDALAQVLGVEKESLLEELDLLTMVGRPPFQPDDFIDVYLENDRVFVHLDQRFSAPPRLTAPEAAALASAAAMLKPAAGEALTRALAKLEKVIPPGAKARFLEIEQKLQVAAAPSELGPLSRAVAERREVELEYFSSGRGQSEARTVQPLEVFSDRGHWYLSAYCLSRQDERLFRLDRVQSLKVTERTFAPRAHQRSTLPRAAQPAGDVKVRFSPQVAGYVKEQFGEEARALTDGGVEVQVSGSSTRWLTQWVLSFGGEAVVVSPAWARRAVADAARASLES